MVFSIGACWGSNSLPYTLSPPLRPTREILSKISLLGRPVTLLSEQTVCESHKQICFPFCSAHYSQMCGWGSTLASTQKNMVSVCYGLFYPLLYLIIFSWFPHLGDFFSCFCFYSGIFLEYLMLECFPKVQPDEVFSWPLQLVQTSGDM